MASAKAWQVDTARWRSGWMKIAEKAAIASWRFPGHTRRAMFLPKWIRQALKASVRQQLLDR